MLVRYVNCYDRKQKRLQAVDQPQIQRTIFAGPQLRANARARMRSVACDGSYAFSPPEFTSMLRCAWLGTGLIPRIMLL
jgi:hypothetical protein